jgi:S1-C subfamily serine protease
MPIEYSKADFVHDVALFKFDPAIPQSQKFAIHPLTLSDSKLDIGAPIGFMGYFASDELPILSQTTVAGYTSTAGIPELLLMDLPANPGQSGSPVFDLRTGAVVGILTAFVPVILVPGGLPTHSGLSRSEEVVHLKRLIESADVR